MRTYSNNKKSVVVMMEDDRVDLSIKLVQGYEALFVGETDTFGARVYNTSDKPISTDIVWKLARKQIRKANITVPAKGSTDDKATIKMPNTAGNVMLEVEVNPSRNKPSNEVTYDNNRVRQTIENLGLDEEDQTGESDPYLVK